MFSYCKNNAIKYADSDGYSARLVGIGAEFELDVGSYVTGVEVIVYWDSEVCKDGELFMIIKCACTLELI